MMIDVVDAEIHDLLASEWDHAFDQAGIEVLDLFLLLLLPLFRLVGAEREKVEEEEGKEQQGGMREEGRGRREEGGGGAGGGGRGGGGGGG
eukprot:8066568-Pyramimonas_sp.AAC.1